MNSILKTKGYALIKSDVHFFSKDVEWIQVRNPHHRRSKRNCTAVDLLAEWSEMTRKLRDITETDILGTLNIQYN